MGRAHALVRTEAADEKPSEKFLLLHFVAVLLVLGMKAGYD